jgi:hypothetical protein
LGELIALFNGKKGAYSTAIRGLKYAASGGSNKKQKPKPPFIIKEEKIEKEDFVVLQPTD